VKLFIDTWGWLTLRDRNESQFEQVKSFYKQFRLQGGIVYTSDYVLDETVTLVFRRLPFQTAREAIDIIDKAAREGYLQLEWITPERFEKAKMLRLKYQDKPRISFTDLTSMVVMQELEIKEIITADEHFEHVGLGFQLFH